MTSAPIEAPELLTPKEVAALFRVDAKTVARWARNNLIPTATRTLGGHRRFDAAVMRELVAAGVVEARPAGD